MEIAESKRNPLLTRGQLRERGFAMRRPPVAMLAYDPAGDGADNDGIVVISREEHQRGELYDPDLAVEMIYRVLMCKYLPRELEFQDKAAVILGLHRNMRSWTSRKKMHDHMVLVEANGVGWAMASFLRDKLGPTRVRPYTTVATLDMKSHKSHRLALPRLAALDHLRQQMDLQRLKTEKDAPGVGLLINEMGSFVWKSAQRPEAIDGQHDDLILPTAACCWFGSKVIPSVTKQQRVTPHGVSDNKVRNGRIRMQ